jgi:hypothetical protein
LEASSTDRRNTGVKSLCWGFGLQGLAWPFVERTGHFVQLGFFTDDNLIVISSEESAATNLCRVPPYATASQGTQPIRAGVQGLHFRRTLAGGGRAGPVISAVFAQDAADK